VDGRHHQEIREDTLSVELAGDIEADVPMPHCRTAVANLRQRRSEAVRHVQLETVAALALFQANHEQRLPTVVAGNAWGEFSHHIRRTRSEDQEARPDTQHERLAVG